MKWFSSQQQSKATLKGNGSRAGRDYVGSDRNEDVVDIVLNPGNLIISGFF